MALARGRRSESAFNYWPGFVDALSTLVLSVIFLLTVFLVVLVIYVFLRSLRATVIPGVAVPLSLIATFGVMKLCGYSLNNLSLMALTISTGFVVDDAIVVTENVTRYLERGDPPIAAALAGARQIGSPSCRSRCRSSPCSSRSC